ncbi:MAG: Mut7-C ubiquitin/RNAse domain-containing protein [Candidatus Hydrogenedentes bacterium]|nr:Mut7-C ubiquitin/RNAse domain-containing protein [Candidatus Hydrogenedentota bacterium]
MYNVIIRFYEELNDFLPEIVQKRDIPCLFPNRRSIKDLIESFGVPHTEVDLILVNSHSVDFSYTVQNGDRISVYPVFESLAIGSVTRLRPAPLRRPAFLCDAHLGKLARRLRILGLDAAFDNNADHRALAGRSRAEHRILLTRDTQLLMRKEVTHGIYVRDVPAADQVRAVLDRLDLRKECRPFTRCTACNGLLNTVTASDTEAFRAVRDAVPERVRQWCAEYTVCAECGKIYWRGTHYAKLEAMVRAWLREEPGTP